jgi:serine/threonine-protein kinase OSR1/STK39
MPYMSGGSCFHLMKSVYPEGLEQPIIATLLREVLKALVYLHRQGHIHRDVKAGNILIHSKGVVKLGDFGVSACMFDSGERMQTRNTFVGTPCWYVLAYLCICFVIWLVCFSQCVSTGWHLRLCSN